MAVCTFKFDSRSGSGSGCGCGCCWVEKTGKYVHKFKESQFTWFVFIGAPAGPSRDPVPGSARSPHFTNNSNCDSCHVLWFVSSIIVHFLVLPLLVLLLLLLLSLCLCLWPEAMLHHRRGCFLWLSLCYLFSAMARPLTGAVSCGHGCSRDWGWGAGERRTGTGAGYLTGAVNEFVCVLIRVHSTVSTSTSSWRSPHLDANECMASNKFSSSGLCFYRATCIIHSLQGWSWATGKLGTGDWLRSHSDCEEGTEVNRNLWVALLTPLITNWLCRLAAAPGRPWAS